MFFEPFPEVNEIVWIWFAISVTPVNEIFSNSVSYSCKRENTVVLANRALFPMFLRSLYQTPHSKGICGTVYSSSGKIKLEVPLVRKRALI